MIDIVRVWLIAVGLPAETAAACWAALDDGERARALTLESPRKQQRFAIAHGALRILAGRVLGARPKEFTWISGRHGKPELAPPWSGLHTNLSHSGDMIAAALSTHGPVGVDIQQLVPSLDTGALSARFFGPDEAAYVAAGRDAGERADRFAHLWARKEAVVKAVGGRLWPNLGIAVHGRDVVDCAEPASSHRVADVAAPANYRAAVALSVDAPFTVDTMSWTGEVEPAGERQHRAVRAGDPSGRRDQAHLLGPRLRRAAPRPMPPPAPPPDPSRPQWMPGCRTPRPGR